MRIYFLAAAEFFWNQIRIYLAGYDDKKWQQGLEIRRHAALCLATVDEVPQNSVR